MALFLSMVDDKIQSELKRRMDITKRSPGIYTRSTWIRMWSQTTNETVLMGGVLSKKGKLQSGFDDMYSPKSEDGSSYRPMSGITNISVDYKGEYGSTRTADIAWLCWSFEEIEKLQPLFLTTGKTVIVEWGWSEGNKNPIYTLKQKDVCDIYKNNGVVRKKVIKNKGNYDAMLGLVTDWTWKIRDDGGIACTTNLIAHGDTALDFGVAPAEGEEKKKTKEPIFGFVADIYPNLIDTEVHDYNAIKSGGFSKKGLLTENKDNCALYKTKNKAFVSWGFIEDEIINKHIEMKSSKDIKIPQMQSVSFKSNGDLDGPTKIYCPTDLKNLDPRIITIEGAPTPFLKFKEGGAIPSGILRNLCVNVDIVIEAFLSADTIEDALEKLLHGINNGACGIWDFKIVQHEEKPGWFGVIDTNWAEKRVKDLKKTVFKFPTWSRNSIVRTQGLQADVPDAMKLSVLYGANKPKKADAPLPVAEEQTTKTTKKLNEESPEDCCLDNPELFPDAAKTAQDQMRTDVERKQAAEDAALIATAEEGDGRIFNKKGDFPVVSPEEQKTICAAVRKASVKEVDPVVPIDLTLTIDGISGIQWGNAIHTDFIPKVYKDSVIFLVTQVNHTVDSSDWQTTIKTVCKVNPE